MPFGLKLPIDMKELLPMAIAVIVEPTIDSYVTKFIPQQQIGPVSLVDIIEVIGAGYLSRKGGMVGKVAKFYGILAIADVVRRLTTGMLGNLTSGTQTTSGWF